ncbi:hypothetical protein NBRC116596_08060 [Litorivita sp. NS0012-18]
MLATTVTKAQAAKGTKCRCARSLIRVIIALIRSALLAAWRPDTGQLQYSSRAAPIGR